MSSKVFVDRKSTTGFISSIRSERPIAISMNGLKSAISFLAVVGSFGRMAGGESKLTT
jgi:hypothetical protein